MSYNIDKDTYICDTCGFEEKWSAYDDYKGSIWECDHCGGHFCTDCFVKECGQEAFDLMMQEADFVSCPKCYCGSMNTIEG